MRTGVIIGFLTLSLFIFFNNCSDVGFQDGGNESQSVSNDDPNSGNSSQNNNNDFEVAPDQSDEEIIDSLPEEERDVYRPISDVDDNPDLREIFECGDNGLYICHFPENEENAHTLCVGGNAPNSHKRHEVTLDDSGNVETLNDYLGPCKH